MNGRDDGLQVFNGGGKWDGAFGADDVHTRFNGIARLFVNIIGRSLVKHLRVVDVSHQTHPVPDLLNRSSGVHLPFKMVTVKAGIGKHFQTIRTVSTHMQDQGTFDGLG